jgi:hypothetical protein
MAEAHQGVRAPFVLGWVEEGLLGIPPAPAGVSERIEKSLVFNAVLPVPKTDK